MNINYEQMVGKVIRIWSPKPREWLPFSHKERIIKVRVRVVGDYKNYIVCTVLPHQGKMGITTPYNITLDKIDIENRRIIID